MKTWRMTHSIRHSGCWMPSTRNWQKERKRQLTVLSLRNPQKKLIKKNQPPEMRWKLKLQKVRSNRLVRSSQQRPWLIELADSLKRYQAWKMKRFFNWVILSETKLDRQNQNRSLKILLQQFNRHWKLSNRQERPFRA